MAAALLCTYVSMCNFTVAICLVPVDGAAGASRASVAAADDAAILQSANERAIASKSGSVSGHVWSLLSSPLLSSPSLSSSFTIQGDTAVMGSAGSALLFSSRSSSYLLPLLAPPSPSPLRPAPSPLPSQTFLPPPPPGALSFLSSRVRRSLNFFPAVILERPRAPMEKGAALPCARSLSMPSTRGRLGRRARIGPAPRPPVRQAVRQVVRKAYLVCFAAKKISRQIRAKFAQRPHVGRQVPCVVQ